MKKMKQWAFLCLFGAMALSSALLSAQTQTFNFTGGIQTFTVPCGVDTVFLQTWGAQGGSGAAGGNSVAGGVGALGGYAEGFLLVNPGDVLNVFVGGQGATPAGGFNGGANGGSQNAGGGGGASDVRVGGTAEANRVVVAGGGGGGGRGGCDEGSGVGGVGGTGGFGGGGVGVNGADSPQSGGVPAGGGRGGNAASVQGAGGAAGIGCGPFLGGPGLAATTGTGGTGGAGQTCCCPSSNSIVGGGGGGGGFLGGGGGGGGSAGTSGCAGNSKGAGGGGGGGSSFVGTLLSGVTNNGIWLGNGQVTISWEDPLVADAGVITGDGVLCEAQNATTTLTVPTIVGADTYNWLVPNNVTITSGVNTNTVGLNFNQVADGDYTVGVFGSNNCLFTGDTSFFVVSVKVLPVVTTVSDTFCGQGDLFEISASGGVSYLWSSGETSASISSDGHLLSFPLTLGVNVTDANGCTATGSASVYLYDLPIVTTVSDTICGQGDFAALSASGGVSYLWSNSEATPSISVTSNVVTTYSVIVTDANGCTGTGDATVSLYTLPVVTVANDTICEGENSLLETLLSGVDYVWSTSETTSSITVSPLVLTAYSVTVTDGNNCTATATAGVLVDTLPLVSFTLPSAIDTLCSIDGAITLTGGSPVGGIYSGTGVNANNFDPATASLDANTIEYTYTDGNGCVSDASADIFVQTCVGIENLGKNNIANVFPNPSKGKFTVELTATTLAASPSLKVLNALGKVVYTSENVKRKNVIDLSNLSVGVYYVKVQTNLGTQTYGVVVQK
jgi:hypothetical protein